MQDDKVTSKQNKIRIRQRNAGMEETEQTRFYAMQEDLNYLIDHLS